MHAHFKLNTDKKILSILDHPVFQKSVSGTKNYKNTKIRVNSVSIFNTPKIFLFTHENQIINAGALRLKYKSL